MIGLFFNTAGTIGVVLILTTYFLLQTGGIKAEQLAYSVLNGIGSALILLSLFYDFNLPSFIVEAAWVLISIVGIVRALARRRNLELQLR